MNEKKFFRSGQLARLAGVSPDTLRHYERNLLIGKPRRSSNGYREYPPETLQRVRVIQAALSIGFTLPELSRIFRKREQGGIPCREVRDLAVQKLAEIEAHLKQLKRVSNHLRNVIAGWERELAGTHDGNHAHLLEILAADRSAVAEKFPRTFARKSKEKGK